MSNPLTELATAPTVPGIASAHRAPQVGDRYRAVATGHAGFEPEATYTVVAVYEGRMDVDCDRLDIRIAGVSVGDPALEYVGAILA